MRRWCYPGVSLALALAAGLHAQESISAVCEGLRTLHVEATRVLTASFLPGGELQQPGSGTSKRPTLQLPAHCAIRTAVATSSDSAVTSEIWLPAPDAWNGKLLATGNGGYSSALSLPEMADGLQRGYAVAGSDTGHQGDSLEFGVGHEERIRDWAYRSTHALALQAKALVTAFYGKAATHAYFAGCSTGGQQALSEAQRFPDDFDGIVAGDPGNSRILLNADFVASWQLTHPIAGDAFPSSKLPLITHAAIAACNRQDGLEEPYISDPTKCSFDPGTLACASATESAACLTPGEVTMVRQLYAGPVHDSAGKPLFAGWPRGSESGWGSYLVSPRKPSRLEFWTSWVLNPATLDLNAFDASAVIAAARAKLPFVEAFDPDLRAFQRRGGKLLVYHGWADPVVPPESTTTYYRQVERILGQSTGASLRLFMVPGMGHCGGGPGATVFDPVAALDTWVRSGVPPSSIMATHQGEGGPAFQRRLCPFPQVARWNGEGDGTKASSFKCTD